MLYFLKSKTQCTGCASCLSVCPKGCISMIEDEEGFLYPQASAECVNCGKCNDVCPSINRTPSDNKEYVQKAFCALTKNAKTWRNSSSGGAFSEICKAFGDSDTIICGAAWDGFDVHHICVKGVENISSLCKSKYISSSTENVYKEIADHLKADKKVVFCGTPCQVAGLKSSLNKSYDNLLTIDLICHGTGSKSVFRECIKALENHFKKNIIHFEFRAKQKYFVTDYLSEITFSDSKKIYITNDCYTQLFLRQLCLRPSCGKNCKYRNSDRQGDITIADFKGLYNVFPRLTGTKRNYSSVIINNGKAEAVIDNLKKSMKLYECDTEDIKKYNPLFCRQTWFCDERDAFFEEFISNPSKAVTNRTTPSLVRKNSFKSKMFSLLPVFARRIIILRRNKKSEK